MTIIAGPPGAGKTTYALTHHKPGDLIVDYEPLWAALSGEPWYVHSAHVQPFVQAAQQAVLMRLAHGGNVRHAWVISNLADVGALHALKAELHADELIILEVDAAECVCHIASDPRRAAGYAEYDQWTPLVTAWWAAYRQSQAGLLD